MIPREQITGVVLAGGQGSRMGGLDKGLQVLHGEPLVQHALRRLAPQVGHVLISANRHLNQYRAWGHPCFEDARDALAPDTHLDAPQFSGPLAGFLSGLQHAQTPYVVTVPCDTPHFPLDLVERLAQALVQARQSNPAARMAMACTLREQMKTRQPVFCLMERGLAEDLQQHLLAGGRKVGAWAMQHGCVNATFDDEAAFFNANTPDDLKQLM